MPVIGFDDSHEQIHPAELLTAVRHAEDVGSRNVFPPPLCWDLDSPEAFERASAHVTPEDVTTAVRVSSDLGQYAAWIAEYLGSDAVHLHQVGQEQRRFLDAFGEHVLPQFDVVAPTPAVPA